MDKAILIIDMPSCCRECPVCASYQESAFSIREYWCPPMNNRDAEPESKPKWCPLKPLPDKMYESGTWTMSGYIADEFPNGWNACIEEILG